MGATSMSGIPKKWRKVPAILDLSENMVLPLHRVITDFCFFFLKEMKTARPVLRRGLSTLLAILKK